MRKKLLFSLLVAILAGLMMYPAQAGSLYTWFYNTTIKLKHTSLSYIFRVVNASNSELFTVDSSGNTYTAGSALYDRNVEHVTTDDTLTAAESGKIFIFDSPSIDVGNATLTLPSAAAGIWFTFVANTKGTSNGWFSVDPVSDNQIIGLTNSPGDSIRSRGVVHAVTLVAINSSHWVAMYVGANGSGTISAWFDNN